MPDQIHPHQLPSALDLAADDIRLLSLDCFDTLIWRNVHKPADLFCDLSANGVTRQQRMWAESSARVRATLRDRRNEATIEEIYQALMPQAGDELRKYHLDAELRAEAEACYAFAPTVRLMQAAKAKGLDIAIVSDTYLNEEQLRALIEAAAGSEVLDLIDHVFCSSVFGVSKTETLFRHVLDATGANPGEILHIGDNSKADLEGARRYGIPALHLLQFDTDAQTQLRLEAAVGSMIEPTGRADAASAQPHRAALAAALPGMQDSATKLGFSVLGPALHGFAEWVDAEARAARASSEKRTHILFMMRDGHLPQRVFDALPGDAQPSTALEISRFTGIASSLTTRAAITSYVEGEILGSALEAIGKQLLLKPGEVKAVLNKLPADPVKARRAFAAEVTAQRNVQKIIRRAEAFADRLTAYVRKTVNPAPGDTLMLVDLGYHGTVQDHVERLLAERFEVNVTGRYLLLREHTLSGCDKKGFLGPDNYGADTLEALAGNVAVLEQLCTVACGSVVDYEEDGTPVRGGSSIKSRQSAVRDRVQQGCVHYAEICDGSLVQRPLCDGPDNRRRAAAAALGRFMFLPQPAELAVLSDFEHDVNLGTEDMVALFDPAVADEGLRRRGMFYLKNADRMYLPAELRGHGLPLSLSLLAQRRFGLDLRFADFCDGAIDLPVFVADGTNVWNELVRATPTHDGYYTAAIPVGTGQFSIGLHFGKLYDWVQVDSVQFIGAGDFLKAAAPSQDAMPTLEGMQQIAPHLMHCQSETAFMMVPPPPAEGNRNMMLTVTFRPIAERQIAEPSVAPDRSARLERVA
ncbi:hypothetical protein B5C34_08780 [Pacificimonas flava]|uniref:Hydrolase n=2 Tax=Pacificimonas TaxID=1960290 RepID=A0A219B608_9SPHN|nr:MULTISPECIES: HAD family hydrolase [Pacificimonas]MBZ6379240.1 HAD family hydrolase [Pacificimonas aurantium]OWV33546.1 hypothetical protein B5C34_08780 [Pacificimonas flava]